MTQIVFTFAALLFLLALMSVGLIFAGKPMRKSCGGIIGGDKSECLICDGGKNDEECPE